MNKYILMLGVAAVSIVSYAAYAGNSATMTVTATIAHDVSLNIVKDINFGTITIDPSQDTGYIWGGDSGVPPAPDSEIGGGVISVSGAQWGEFTANLPAGTDLSGMAGLGNTDNSFDIDEAYVFHIADNRYRVQASLIYYEVPAAGVHNDNYLIIRYIPH
ncbi:MAG: hypothetical protein IJ689_02785 [Alphaproteobacteria bacterium]|nr:hypothetical protein [Alphaproteobacteria bacterium]